MQLSDAFIDLLSEKFLYASLVVQEPASRWMDQLFDGVPENESLKWNYNNYLLLESKQVRIPVRAIIGTYEYNSKSFLWGLPSHPFYEMAKEENVLQNAHESHAQ